MSHLIEHLLLKDYINSTNNLVYNILKVFLNNLIE